MVELIEKLIEYGIDKEQENNKGLKPIHLLSKTESNCQEDFEFFRQTCNKLMELGFDFESETSCRKRLLHLMCESFNTNLLGHYQEVKIEYLIKLGLDTSVYTLDNQTPISLLSRHLTHLIPQNKLNNILIIIIVSPV